MPAVVGVVHRHVALAEQQRLGVAVVFHGLVEVQMVLGEIGEHAHRKGNAVHPVQRQRVGGYLHHHVGAARVRHLPEQALQFKGLRRGALGGDHLVADHVLNGADKTHLGPGLLLQNALDEIGGRGLAVGAGDAHHGHLPGRVVKPIGADDAQRPPGVFHHHAGDFPLHLALADGAHRALFRRHGHELVAVHGEAGHRHEQISRLGKAAVVADAGDFRLHVRGGGAHGHAPQQIFQFHRTYLLLPAAT